MLLELPFGEIESAVRIGRLYLRVHVGKVIVHHAGPGNQLLIGGSTVFEASSSTSVVIAHGPIAYFSSAITFCSL